jgi:hypothetical protein
MGVKSHYVPSLPRYLSMEYEINTLLCINIIQCNIIHFCVRKYVGIGLNTVPTFTRHRSGITIDQISITLAQEQKIVGSNLARVLGF